MGEPGPLLLMGYILVKYAAYAAWCRLAMGWLLGLSAGAALAAGLAWGLLRLFMGFVLGVLVIPEAVTHIHHIGHREDFGVYFAVYVPVRVVEWAMMVLLFAWMRAATNRQRQKANAEIQPFLVGEARVVAWVAGGIVISCLADIPVFWAIGGFPIGRFWC